MLLVSRLGTIPVAASRARCLVLAVWCVVALAGCDSSRDADDGSIEATISGSGASVEFEGGSVTVSGRESLTFLYNSGSDSFLMGLDPVGDAALDVGTFEIVPLDADRTETETDGFEGSVSVSFDEPFDGLSFTRSGTLTIEVASESVISGTVRLVTADVGPDAPEDVRVEAAFRAVR